MTRLGVLVFTAGAAALATEFAGARLLAPFFGTSNVVWANVIGLILIYLSLGYYLGGKLADRYPTERALALVVLVAAAMIAVLPFVTRPLFAAAAEAFTEVSAGAYIGSFLATLLMFGIPVTALGAVSPWAIRLSVSDIEHAGTVAGRLYALSTLGSIAGTFIPVLVLIPWIGVRRTLLVIAVLLALAALPALPRRALAVPLAGAALITLPVGPVRDTDRGRLVFEDESAYQFIQVIDEPNGDRMLELNEGWAVHSELPRDGKLTEGYWDQFIAAPLLAGTAAPRVAILGNAAGTVSNLIAIAWPESRIDGVEIDPDVSAAGRRFFAMARPNLTVHTADARPWIAYARDRFDVIVVDAYRQPYIPFHLATREFFRAVRDHLEPGGVLAMNIATPPGDREIVDRLLATIAADFPTVQQARFDDFNEIVVAYRRPTTVAQAVARLAPARGLAAGPSARLAARLGEARGAGEPFTDDHAPLEWLTDRALFTYIREGAPGA